MIGPAVYHSDYSGLTCPTPLRTTGAMNPLHRGHAQLLHQALAYMQRLQSWETWRDRKTMKILAFQAVQTTRCGSLRCVPTGISALMCTCEGKRVGILELHPPHWLAGISCSLYWLLTAIHLQDYTMEWNVRCSCQEHSGLSKSNAKTSDH